MEHERRKEDYEVRIRIQSFEDKFDNFIKESNQRHLDTDKWRERISDDLRDLKHTINGSASVVGILERVRKLENVMKHIYSLWCAIILFSANAIKDFFIGKH